MTPAADLDPGPDRLWVERRLRGLPHGVRQRFEVVVGRCQRVRVRRKPDHLPAARRGEPLAVPGAQVVAVRLGVRRQRTEHGS